MTVLSNVTIREHLRCDWPDCSHHLRIIPFESAHVQPASYDLMVQLDRPLLLAYGQFHLLTTIEQVRIPPNMRGQVIARSSAARLGLQVEWAGYLDPGFEGQITLEVINWHKVFSLYPRDRIAQISFEYLDQTANPPYKGRYQHQVGVTESKFEHGEA